MRATQQVAAGNVHHPVHAIPPHGEPSAAVRTEDATAELERACLQALDNELAAWHSSRGLPGEAGFDQVTWNRWRSAVEERDLATRLLMNYALTDQQ